MEFSSGTATSVFHLAQSVENVVDRSTEKYSVGVRLDFLIRSLPDIYDLSLNGTVPSRFDISVTVNTSGRTLV